MATGLNLSAFGIGKRPVIASATLKKNGEVKVSLAPAPFFAGRSKLSDSAIEIFKAWRMAMLELAKPLVVDIALDTTQLSTENPEILWQVTHRPVDFAFYGEAPETSAVGEFSQRFRAFMASSQFDLGKDIFETMPGAIVELYNFKGQYKSSSAHHGQHGWKPDNKQKRSDRLLCNLLTELGINPGNKSGAKLTSSEFDAVICALTALAIEEGKPLMNGGRLAEEITQRAKRRANADKGPNLRGPNGLSLLAQPFWESIEVTKLDA